jgi:hypothetical protein
MQQTLLVILRLAQGEGSLPKALICCIRHFCLQHSNKDTAAQPSVPLEGCRAVEDARGDTAFCLGRPGLVLTISLTCVSRLTPGTWRTMD